MNPFSCLLLISIFVTRAWSLNLAVRTHNRVLCLSSAPKGLSIKVSSSAPRNARQIPQTLQIGGLFGVWYALNVGYNIYTKKLLNGVPQLTYSVGFVQLFFGLLYVLPLWITGARKLPKLSKCTIKVLVPISVLHLLTHLGSLVSLGAGAISFTSVVKSAEPAVSAFLSAAFYQSYLPVAVYLSLVPIMAGVAYASLGELSFSALSFCAAMVSNFASAGRALVSKKALTKSTPDSDSLDATDLYSVLTIMAAMLALPVCLVLEGKTIMPTLKALLAAGHGRPVAVHALLSALFYYAYNEVAFQTLDKVAPVTHAVGNTIKRVIIILTSVVVFGTQMTVEGAVGSAVAIAGVLLYTLTKSRYSEKSAKLQ